MRGSGLRVLQPDASPQARLATRWRASLGRTTRNHVMWIGVGLLLFGLMSIGHVRAIDSSRSSEQHEILHDIEAHIQYCQFIAEKHALPHPRAGWTTYHPPLFYLFAQVFHPLQDSRDTFIRNVRWANASLFASLFLFSMLGIARALAMRKAATLLVVGFLISLPSVVQLFAGFNNDPMATALTALTAFAALRFYQSTRRGASMAWATLVVAAGTLALYAKFTSLFAFAALAGFVAIGLAMRKLRARAYWLAGLGVVCFLALLPYLYLRNYRSTGKLFPHNVENPTAMAFSSMDLHGGRLGFLLTPPLLTDREWDTPYATRDVGELWWLKGNLLASAFVTSLYGEWDFNLRGRPNGVFLLSKNRWGWLGVWAHASFLFLILFWALAFRSATLRSALLLAGLILGTHACQVMLIMPFYNAANFRYYAWILLPLAVAGIAGLQHKSSKSVRVQLAGVAVLGLGTLIHLGFVLSAL